MPPDPGPLTAAKNALQVALAAALPGRMVTRKWLPYAQRSRDELLAGVVTLAGLGEEGFANYRGREADLGTLRVVVVGQIEVDSKDPQDVEDAEDALAEEIKAFLRSDWPPEIRACLATGFRQSGQLEAPYGWVAFEMEVQTA